MQRRHVLIAPIGVLLLPAAHAHHGWSSFDQGRPIYLEGSARKKLRQEFLAHLPSGCDASERWLVWEFRLPRERPRMLQTAAKITSAIQEVLVPNTPDDVR